MLDNSQVKTSFRFLARAIWKSCAKKIGLAEALHDAAEGKRFVKASLLSSNTMAGVYFLYSATLTLLLVVTLPWWLVQMLRLGKYRAGLWERLGLVPSRIRQAPRDAAAGTVWIHAVSVGEVLAIVPLVCELQARGYRVVVSTTTHTGQRLARDRFGEGQVFYFPLDLGVCIRPYLRALRPRLVILAETEFWPNFLRLARASGAHLAVVNARISDRSLPRYRRWRQLLHTALEPVELFLAQSEDDAARLREIGAAAERVEVAGNLKFDIAEPVEAEPVRRLGERLRAAGGQVIVAGSTVDGEEEFVLQGFRLVLEEYPAAVLVLAPRHRERFEAVARLMDAKRFRWLRRSAQGPEAQELAGKVLLLDTLGELAAVYRYADLAFVGGSLVPRGGHNILEPAFFARTILTGPHMENFREIVSCFERRSAVVRCNTKNLGITFLLLLREPAEREALGRRAQQVLAEERGATARSVERLIRLVSGKLGGGERASGERA
jgi:3-deoxy-D-manno-octulosonic-acid transferase